MKVYNVWLSSKDFVTVESPCPSMAIELVKNQMGVRYIWKIEKGGTL